MQFDFKGLSSHLREQTNSILIEWLPGGHINGAEYCCANLTGARGNSLRVNLKTGVWCDFAGDDTHKGGDLLSLYCAIHQIKPADAYQKLADQYSFQPTISFKHYKYGEPVQKWAYHDKYGKVTHYIARYDSSDGKQFIPWTYFDDDLKNKGFPAPRPLYNLHKLVKYPSRPVLIVEGEKCADAAQLTVGDKYVVTTWSNGAKSYGKADWSILKDRNILLWADADEPGILAMDKIAHLLKSIAKTVKLIQVLANGNSFDAADAVFTWGEFMEWAKPKAVQVFPEPEKPEKIIEVVAQEDISKGDAVTDDGYKLSAEPIKVPDNNEFDGSKVVLWDNLGLAVNGQGTPNANIANILRVFRNSPYFAKNIWYDDFYHTVFINGKPVTDSAEVELTAFIQDEVGIQNIHDSTVAKTINLFARQHTRNEPQEWIKSLKWDGTPRITEFLHLGTGCEDNEYSRAVSRNFMLSMTARIIKPGCKCDTMIILEGGQGIKKSTFLESVVSSKWHTEAVESINSNNFYQCLNGKMLIEFADLSTWTNADVNKLKQILSNKKDTYRAPYERHSGDHLRSSVFAGTTNESVYLKDETGARRFYPIRARRLDISYVRDIREQIFAEAAHIFNSETPEYDDARVESQWWEIPDSALNEQDERRVADPWEVDITNFVCGIDKFYMDDIMEKCLHIEKSKKTKYDAVRIGKILSMLNFEKKRESFGNRGYYYETVGQVWDGIND